MEEVLNKIFENKNNTVTLNLCDYEAIKAVFEENKKLKEELKDAKSRNENLIRPYVKADIPVEVVEAIMEGKADVKGTQYQSPVDDPLVKTYGILFKVR